MAEAISRPDAAQGPRGVRIRLTGIVQGVGMRPFVYRMAREHGIAGWVLNARDGVHIEAHAPAAALDAFVRDLRLRAPRAARIAGMEVEDCASGAADPSPGPSFRILASDAEQGPATLVSPDIATCDDCLRELFDPADRRFHYPFINCTNCGPRFTIIRALPYDRAATSMDRFPMCPACDAEYRDPADRRFHAQPNACFSCGPHITWRERDAAAAAGVPAAGDTREASDAIIARCAELIARGGIVAVKGLGGFHIACDAGNAGAVDELRRRKRRGDKPLAVMVARLEDARALCEVDGTEAELLQGSARPIVLLGRRADAPAEIAPNVAFDLPELGVMLPYTPLQHLLLAACGKQGTHALVMTSGNVSGEPIEIDDKRAWSRLGGIVDALLGNDRAILSRYDDSVVRVARGLPLPVRRARGYAPRPLPLPASDASAPWDEAPTVLACGAEQKAALALTREQEDGGAQCFLSQHVGDVERATALAAWHDARTRLEALFDLHPTVLACDAHPAYLTGQWARAQARERGIPCIEVQHHHAHIASVIAEAACAGAHDPARPVIGVALDGTGAGDDGTVWGGEVLVADLAAYRRAAHLRTWRLPGGAAAVRDARRSAFALLCELDLLGHPGAATLLAQMDGTARAVTRTMVERGINSPLTSSMGRLFDAAAALLGVCGQATYEGEPACLLEAAARRSIGADDCGPEAPRTAEPLDAAAPSAPTADGGCAVIDTAPVIEELLDGMAAQVPTDLLALAFHRGAARLVCRAVLDASARTGVTTVALSGGVFMNRVLLDLIADSLELRGLKVLIPRTAPVNDGCIAYGQAAIARARLQAGPGGEPGRTGA